MYLCLFLPLSLFFSLPLSRLLSFSNCFTDSLPLLSLLRLFFFLPLFEFSFFCRLSLASFSSISRTFLFPFSPVHFSLFTKSVYTLFQVHSPKVPAQIANTEYLGRRKMYPQSRFFCLGYFVFLLFKLLMKHPDNDVAAQHQAGILTLKTIQLGEHTMH